MKILKKNNEELNNSKIINIENKNQTIDIYNKQEDEKNLLHNNNENTSDCLDECKKSVFESITELKKEIEEKLVIVEKEKKNTSEALARLGVENKKFIGEKEKVEKATKEAIEAYEQAAERKKEYDKAITEAEPAKLEALNDIINIKNDDLEKFKNMLNPSKNIFRIYRLIYLIFNPKDSVPDDDIKKDLPNIKKKCLNQSADQMKRKMISLLDDVSWITEDFKYKIRMYREYPYTDLKEMEKISGACRGIVGYFQNIINYKRLYDNAKEYMKRYQQLVTTAAACYEKKKELENNLETVSGTQRKLQKEYDESKAKLDKVQEEHNTLLTKLETSEKIIRLLSSKNESWKKM